MKPEAHSRRQIDVSGWPVTVETYRLGGVYHCAVASVDAGARLARGEGSSRDAAESQALEQAGRYLARTRRFEPTSASPVAPRR